MQVRCRYGILRQKVAARTCIALASASACTQLPKALAVIALRIWRSVRAIRCSWSRSRFAVMPPRLALSSRTCNAHRAASSVVQL